MFSRAFLLLIVLFSLLACSTNPKEKVVSVEVIIPSLEYSQTFFEPVDVTRQSEIFELSDAQKKAFLEYYHAPENQDELGYMRLYKYLEDSLTHFNFRGDTLPAEQALNRMAGNCLTLAILTTALAKTVDLKVSYEKVNSAPIYHRFHHVMTLSYHVRTHLHENEVIKKEDGLEFIKRRMVIDYFPNIRNVSGDKVKERDFIVMFYNNLAGDAIVSEDYALAFSLLDKALSLSPQNASSLNSLAVLFKKLGDKQQAEKIYQYAVQYSSGSLNLLSNYVILLEEQGRNSEAQALLTKLDGIEDDNPYRWLDMGNAYYAKSEFYRAIKYYTRAIEVGPYLHEMHFGLAKAYHAIGQTRKAKEAMEEALSWSYVPEEQNLYQAKLSMFEGPAD